jgi:ubiquinone biosynthesis monooxygenase Coq7
MATVRRYSTLDNLIMRLDKAVSPVFGEAARAGRENPAHAAPPDSLVPAERRHAAGLMRVDHAGEVSAQALYQGQGLTARDPVVREKMQQSADEEIDHLVWCRERLQELDSRTSYLDPLWYVGSFTLGALAGLCGDAWSLGFVAETERQVVQHLDSHLHRLPAGDDRSRRILVQMREDEQHHGTVALEAGARELPSPVRRLMRLCSRVMTTTAYYI